MKTIVITMLLAVLLATPSFVSAQSNPVPSGYKLKKEADYKKYEQDVLKCIEWYDNNPINKYPAIRKEVENFLFAWHEGTPYVSITVADMAIKSAAANSSLILTYMNGWSKYVINGGDDKNKAEALLAAMNHVLDTYLNPNNGFDNNKYLDKLAKARDKGQLKDLVDKEAATYK